MKGLADSILRHRRNISIVLIAQILTGIGAFVGVRLLTEFISPEVFGEYKLLLSGVSLTIGLLVRPVIQFAMREYHDALITSDQDNFINSMRKLFNKYIFVLVTIIGVVLTVLTYMKPNGNLLILNALVILVLTVKIDFENGLLISKNNQFAASIITVAKKWFIPLVILLVLWLYGESVLLITLSTLFALIVIWFLLIFIENKNTSVSKQYIREISQIDLFIGTVKYGWPIAIVGALSWVVNECDRFFLLYYHNNEAVGIYAAAYGLVSTPFVMTAAAIARVSYPIIFRNSAQNQDKKQSVSKILLVNSLIALLGIALVYGLKNIIATIGLGENYREPASELLVWIAVGYGCFSIATSFDLMAYGNKRTSDMFVSYGLASIVTVIFNFLLIPSYSALGAAISTMLALMTYLITMAILFYRKTT